MFGLSRNIFGVRNTWGPFINTTLLAMSVKNFPLM